jgi:hypothetical protein
LFDEVFWLWKLLQNAGASLRPSCVANPVSNCHHPMQEADRIPAILQEETVVPFTVALPSGDVDSAEQTIFMVPDIDDPRHKSDFANSPVLLWISPTVRGSLNGASIPVPGMDRRAEGVDMIFSLMQSQRHILFHLSLK